MNQILTCKYDFAAVNMVVYFLFIICNSKMH
jgi:hypothetical protein